MSILNHKKNIVAPQISIYKNIFDGSKDLIDLINNENKSLFKEWRKWYSQGSRKGISSYSYKENIDNDDLKNKEIKLLNEYLEIIKFIRNDYFLDFNKDNGIWPEFIEDWDHLIKNPSSYSIDVFKYDCISDKDKGEGLMLEYHVDEFELSSEDPIFRNVCTLNLYLNDDYDGGEICMYSSVTEKAYKYKPNAGDIVIMPSTYPFYHGVKKFYNSDRYFMRSFFSYLAKPSSGHDIRNKIKEDQFIKDHLQTIKILQDEIEIN